ncbi:MAG: hypothetical protein JO086_01490 [Acidimicrobiia bacterium]|nr:hypothetical protein [Acidimicrobiia bacterium]
MSFRRDNPNRGRMVILSAAAGVVVAIVIFAGVISLVGSGKAKSKLGSNLFHLGKAKNQAKIVERNGPLLFADPLEKGRDIYVNELARNQWVAVEVHPPGESKSCTVKWVASTKVFHDPCSGHDFPADGTGLVRYHTFIEKSGDLVVDLHQPIS